MPVTVASCVAVLLAGLSLLAAAAPVPSPAAASARGKRLFHGLDAVPATVQQNGAVLPAHASKCINCHSVQAPTAASTGSSQYLTAATLARKSARRGGPAYVYDPTGFCDTIRSGIDPAGIMLESKMPRYKMSDKQCDDLWAFLSSIR